MPGKEVMTFGDTEVDKRKFYRYKNRIFLNDVHVDNILVSKKISFGKKDFKQFIGYLDKN